MPDRLGHRHPDDRFLATLRPRRELLEALWNLAFWETDKRRRKAGHRKVSVLKVSVWVQASQARVIAAYRRHTKYQLREDARTMSTRTLSRQIGAFKHARLVNVINPSYFDRKRGEWVTEPNVYTVTYFGKLWIKRHARSVTNPLVV